MSLWRWAKRHPATSVAGATLVMLALDTPAFYAGRLWERLHGSKPS